MSELTTLSTLAVEINALNEQMYFYGSQTVATTAKLGEKLAKVKEENSIKTNADFVNWLSNNCPNVDRSRANRYIQISKQFPDLINNSGATSRLKISQITELLSAPEEVKEEVTAKIESGEDVTIKEIQRLKKEAAEAKEMLEKANQNAMQTALKLDDKQDEIAKLKGQNWKLENQQQQIIDEKVKSALEVAKMQNLDAIRKAEESANLAKNELERLKREQQKAIQDGITLELNKLETEMNKKRYQIEAYERDLNDLKKVKSELDADVGAIAIHKQAIKEVKNHLTFLTTSFADAFDTATIPAEVSGEWDAIFYAISKLKKQMADWRDQCSPIESESLIGELVD